MDAYAVERSPSSNEMLRLAAGLQSALTLEEVERAYLSNVVGVLDADGAGPERRRALPEHWHHERLEVHTGDIHPWL